MKKIDIQRISLIGTDILSLFLSLYFASLFLSYWRPSGDNISFGTLGIAKLAGLMVIMIFGYQEQYVKRRPVWEELHLLSKTIFIFAAIHFIFTFFLSHHVIKFLYLLFWLGLWIIIPVLRFLCKQVLNKFGLWSRDVFIIGTGEVAIATASLLSNNKILGYNIIGFVDVERRCHTLSINNTAVLPYETLLLHDIHSNDVEIVFALPSVELYHHVHKINTLQSHYAFVTIVPDIVGLPLYGIELEHFFGSEQLFLRLQNNLGRLLNRMIKRTIDIVLSICGLLVLLPFFIIVGILIKMTTNGSIFFGHRRVGLNGKPFFCMKFQTMLPNSQIILEELLKNDANARAEWEKDFKIRNDPRITKIGNILRKTSLDELPQLFNVLRGEMSLIGPRPIVEAEISKYEDDFYYYRLVRPGITGLWQISGRNDTDYINRVRLDVWYVKNWSLWYDFIILVKTIFVVLKCDGAY